MTMRTYQDDVKMQKMYCEQAGNGFYNAWTYSDGERHVLFAGRRVSIALAREFSRKFDLPLVLVRPLGTES